MNAEHISDLEQGSAERINLLSRIISQSIATLTEYIARGCPQIQLRN